jgi:hypothetical protein
MAKRSGYDGVLNNAADGKPMADLEVTVKTAADTSATIYTTKTGGTLKSNPITTNSTGLIQFWVEPGYYELAIRDTIIPKRVSDRRIPFNAVAGDIAGIDINQIEIPTGSIEAEHIALATYYNVGNPVSGTYSDKTFASVSSVVPGFYHATGQISHDGAGADNLRFTASSGAATIFNSTYQAAGTEHHSVSAIIIVTSTATIQLKGAIHAGFGMFGGFTMYGIKL